MIDIHTGLELKNIPILEDEQVYIYAMLNTCNKIKIGITKNIQQRYQSLCGSNSQGNEIIKVYVSESTYLNNLEKMIHEHFGQFRLKKTEWFALMLLLSGNKMHRVKPLLLPLPVVQQV